MRLTCPHCQQSVAVPDSAAGQATPCPLCGQTFTPPALVGAAIDAAPEPAPKAPQPAVRPPAATPPAGSPTADVPRPATAESPGAAATSLAGAPCCRLTLRRSVIPWLAPVALVV